MDGGRPPGSYPETERSPVAAALAALLVAMSGCTIRVASDAGGASPAKGSPKNDAGSSRSSGRAGGGEVTIEQSGEAPPRSPVAEVVDDVLPSVANVRVTSVTSDAFGNPAEGRGEGSGVVIDENGVILTNNHVVAGAVRVTVVLGDRELKGTIIGTVPEKDLAVIRVSDDNLDPITIGHSDELRLGDSVLAVGFPLGLSGGPTVTRGILSGSSRVIQPQGGPKLEGLLQTDAAINPGNSGGALVDRSGALVGINTAAATPSAAENTGFAIAIDNALPVVEEILNDPPEERAWLGVFLGPVDPSVAAQLDIPPTTRGALISGVVPGGPAQAAGLQEGDVITAVDGAPVESTEQLVETLRELDPGDTVELTIVDSDGERSVEVELAQRPVTLED